MHVQTDIFLSMAVYGQVLQDIPNAEISNDLVSLGNSYFFLLSGDPDVTEPFAYLWRRCCDRKKVANSPENTVSRHQLEDESTGRGDGDSLSKVPNPTFQDPEYSVGYNGNEHQQKTVADSATGGQSSKNKKAADSAAVVDETDTEVRKQGQNKNSRLC
jgi:hypothetical protein